jgi:hypothetical protein
MTPYFKVQPFQIITAQAMVLNAADHRPVLLTRYCYPFSRKREIIPLLRSVTYIKSIVAREKIKNICVFNALIMSVLFVF